MRFGIVAFATSVPRVGPTCRILEKSHPREIVFELKVVEINAIHRLYANAYKLFS
jgi:hypothetical protein